MQYCWSLLRRQIAGGGAWLRCGATCTIQHWGLHLKLGVMHHDVKLESEFPLPRVPNNRHLTPHLFPPGIILAQPLYLDIRFDEINVL